MIIGPLVSIKNQSFQDSIYDLIYDFPFHTNTD